MKFGCRKSYAIVLSENMEFERMIAHGVMQWPILEY